MKQHITVPIWKKGLQSRPHLSRGSRWSVPTGFEETDALCNGSKAFQGPSISPCPCVHLLCSQGDADDCIAILSLLIKVTCRSYRAWCDFLMKCRVSKGRLFHFSVTQVSVFPFVRVEQRWCSMSEQGGIKELLHRTCTFYILIHIKYQY